ncbi:YbhB/YbcL family Raf kinase inhibitor-like protein [Actinoplanes sp. L3-i22]|uniref:YbhB/YbcL family Raf kinase inhibitor-like protein n=1 Tax=Actinoplanes sp. L3-i22 TaxID=2836373 RepID=UPI001C77FD97|nr:YbhB/YbcL family Raf kinase inhibitor-like protein [Actinoplanes sp. L3-i22]BCY05086.1 phosphatidylethanolamine-binding protein [Actinoplanes sp. L3-i22]
MSLLVTLVTPLGRMLRNRRPDEALSVRHAPELAAPRAIDLRSAAFEAGGTIPDKHCSLDLGPNVAPELTWSGVPAGTAQLLFVLEDIDVPMKRPALHTIALLPAGLTSLAEGAMKPGNPEVRFVPGERGRVGYFGPRPLPGHGVHRYGFHLYALDQAIPAAQELPGWPAVLAAVRGHVLADGFLEGIKEG